jgi:hypothetical protein
VRAADGIGANLPREENRDGFCRPFDHRAGLSVRGCFRCVLTPLSSLHNDSSVRPRAPPAFFS